MTLQEQAEIIIKKFDLLNEFSKYGEAHLVGNVALGTTVKPDIDVQIYANPEKREENASNIIKYFADLGENDFITRNLVESGKFLLSYAFIDQDGTRWTIDITQTVPQEDYLKDAYKFYIDHKDKFNSENTKIIIKLKQYFIKRDMLHHSMSFYIYNAVINNNAKTVKDVFDYLSENNISISKFRGKKKKNV